MIRTPERTTSALSAVIHFFDTWARRDDAAAHPEPDRVDWVRTLPFLLMHVVCLAVIWVGWSPVAVWTAVGLYFVRMFAITGFYHRYFSHRTFRTSRVAQFLFALLGATAVQRGPLWWAAHHRHHHKHSDQEEDLHSPVQVGFFRSHMGWLMTPKNFPTQLHLVKDLSKFPELCFLDRFDTLIPIVLATVMFGFGALLEAVAPGLGTNGWQMLVWGFFISTVVLFHGTCTINSLSHVIGTRPYKTTDTSRNNFVLALITLGEGWHNNHHHYQGSVRQGFRWWQVDITYYVLRTMSLLGIVWKLNPVPAELRGPVEKQPPA